jgi:AmpD protein
LKRTGIGTADSTDNPGWLRDVRHVPSPNFDARPGGVRISLLVLHHISLPPGYFAGDAVSALFTNTLNCDAHPAFDELRGLRVSSHFLITRHGGIRQFVDVYERAWHAGVSRFGRHHSCNDFSVGIELLGDGQRPFTRSQYRSLFRLTAELRTRLPLRHVAGHSDIAPGRKFDPGPCFDWSRFMRSASARGLSRPQVVPLPR